MSKQQTKHFVLTCARCGQAYKEAAIPYYVGTLKILRCKCGNKRMEEPEV